jgi:exopolysaccharide production protein ExoZ
MGAFMKQLIQTVQILRALAAVLVVLVHSQYGAMTAASSHFFSWGRMPEAGVDLFFVISGFIMMLVSDGRESTPGVFLLRRIQRIVPLYWAYTLALAALAVAIPSALRFTTLTPDLLLRSLFFIPTANPVNGVIQPLLSAGWTLQYEMFFYLCFAAAIRLSLGARVATMATLFGGLMILTGLTGRETAALQFLGNPLVLEFVAGMGVYWLYRRGWVTRRAAVPIGLIVLPAALWLVGSGVAAPLEDAVDHRWIRPIAWGIPAVLLFYVGVAIREVPGAVGRALAHLGDASYSLYLCHWFVVAAILKVWAALGHNPSATFGVLFVMPCCIVAGLVSHRWIETPLGKAARGDWIKRFRPAARPLAQPAADPAGPESRPGRA